ncbi:MAG TPA: hypothetical protein EYG03_14580 [Planctomycetes bacterium]|nr:hypothetical protein [Fuerstiella sp.]HIK93186.1 hypothetical protein [Planctomycetota bacterium]
MSPSSHQPAAAPTFLDSPAESEFAGKPRGPVSQLSTQSLEFIEQQYGAYLQDRNSVSPDWREYFDEIHAGHEDVTPALLKTPFQRDSIFHRRRKKRRLLKPPFYRSVWTS